MGMRLHLAPTVGANLVTEITGADRTARASRPVQVECPAGYRQLAAGVMVSAFHAALSLARAKRALRQAEEAQRVGWALRKPSLVEMKRLSDAVDYAHSKVAAAAGSRAWLLEDSLSLSTFAALLGKDAAFFRARLIALEAEREEHRPSLVLANQNGAACGQHNWARTQARRARRERMEAGA